MKAIYFGFKNGNRNEACGIFNGSHGITCGVLVFILFLIFASGSEAAFRWARAYGGDESDYFNSLQQTADGGYVFAGSTRSFGAEWNDAWVVKLDCNGRVSWGKRYGGTDWSDWDGARSIRQTADGGYIVAGENDILEDDNLDIYLYKLDENGNLPPCISGFETHTTNATVSIPSLPLIIVYTYNVQDTTATVSNSTAAVTDTSTKARLMCPWVGHLPSMMLLLDE